MESVHEYGGLTLDQRRPLAEVATGYTYFRDGDVLAAKITPCFENGKGSIADGLVNGIGFYNNQNTRVGERFAVQVILAAKGGRVSFKEAYDLTGLRGGAFQEYASRLGVNLP
jgi:hypothetical protein